MDAAELEPSTVVFCVTRAQLACLRAIAAHADPRALYRHSRREPVWAAQQKGLVKKNNGNTTPIWTLTPLGEAVLRALEGIHV